MVISGNRPVPSAYINYPDFIQFDHQNMNNLGDLNLGKVALISQNFRDYSMWNGLGKLTKPDSEKIKALIKKAHSAGKPFRFWGTPDTKKAWDRFAKMGVDFINTDHPAEAAAYLKNLDKRAF